jgi:uncharacterized protein YbaP (TraB family)
MRLSCCFALLAAAALPLAAPAQAGQSPIPPPAATPPAPPPAGPVTTLATVTVSGVQPGPGLWKVSKGDHVLWVLGTIPQLPERMQWRSAEVEQVIAASQELIEPPKVKVDAHVGFFGKLLLLPSAYGARKNPDGRTLQDILPPPLYARWQVLRQQYLGDERGIERWRPIFAAMELQHKALKRQGLRSSGAVLSTVKALADRHGVRRTATTYTLVIEHPRAAIAAFKQSGPGDVTCFARTLESVEHDLPAMGTRANAWAVGDVGALRAMPDSHYRDACIDSLVNAGFARQLGLGDVQEKVGALWLDAARAALEKDRQALALLPMDDLLAADGLLARLKGQGYTVVAPDEDEAAPSTADAVPASGLRAPPVGAAASAAIAPDQASGQEHRD